MVIDNLTRKRIDIAYNAVDKSLDATMPLDVYDALKTIHTRLRCVMTNVLELEIEERN